MVGNVDELKYWDVILKWYQMCNYLTININFTPWGCTKRRWLKLSLFLLYRCIGGSPTTLWHNILRKFQYCNVRIQILLRHYKLSMSDNRLIGYQYYNSSFTINHPHGFRTDPFFPFPITLWSLKQYHTQSHVAALCCKTSSKLLQLWYTINKYVSYHNGYFLLLNFSFAYS